MKVSVIIVSYNFEKWIDRCLGSLRESSYPLSVIVVDNGSKDHTTHIIAEKYPEVHLIQNNENLGFGKANNIGFRYALEQGANYFFLLNQDAWIDNNTVETLLLIFSKYPEYGILSPAHLNDKGDQPDFGFSTYTGVKEKKEFLTLRQSLEVIPTPFINAAFWMISAKALETVGGFSPLFYHYGEDIDYINRLRYHGFLLGYSPAVFGYHDRENRTVTREAFFRSEKVYLLSEYANINYSFSKAFGFGFLAGIKKAILAVLNGKPANLHRFLQISFDLLGKTGNVLHIRRISKTKAPNFI